MQQSMKQKWTEYLKGKGQEIFKEEQVVKKQFRIVEDILEFKKKSEDLLSKLFIEKGDFDQFKMGLKESFEQFLNINPNQIAEFLAKFLDMHLKKSTSQIGGIGNDN